MELIRNIKKTARKYHLILSLSFFGLFLLLVGYLSLLNHPPDFNHVWRQSDSVSLVKNYYHGGMTFFEPQTYNLVSNDGTTGHATSEMPYLYYLVAGLQHLFGEEFWVYRLTWIFILFFGFASLYLLFKGWIKSGLTSFLAALIIFSSPVVVFYGNSFIPDVPAFCFAIAGWFFFFKWSRNNRFILLWLTALFFVLAGLLKATALLSFFALAGVWGLELFGLKLGEGGKRVFEERWKAAIPFAIGFGLLFAWYFWAWHYNQIHGTFLFSMQIHPIWKSNQIDPNLIQKTFREIRLAHLPMVTSNVNWFLLIFSLMSSIVFLKKVSRLLTLITIFLFLGVLAIFFLWFSALLYHDYYFIVMLMLPVFVLLNFLVLTSKTIGNHPYAKYVVTGVLAFVTIFGIAHTVTMQKSRTDSNWQVNNYTEPLVPLLDELHITPNDKIISLPDPTPNHSLSTLNRKGWSGFYGANDIDHFLKCLKNGAKYLIVADFEQTLARRPFLEKYLNEPMGRIGQTRVFRIDGKPANRFMVERVDTISYIINNNLLVGENGTSFSKQEDPNAGAIFPESHMHNFSFEFEPTETNTENQFALTSRTVVGHAKYASIKIRRKGAAASLVVVLESSKPLYLANTNGLPKAGSDWEEIIINVSLDGCKPTDELVAYGWNHTDEIVFFANIEILLYDSSVTVVGEGNEN